MDDLMVKCPWCGSDMQKGKLNFDRLSFLADGAKPPIFYPRGRCVVLDNAVFFSNLTLSLNDLHVSYRCPDCCKIVIKY